MRGGPVRGWARVLGRGLALATARDQLHSFVALKVTTSLRPSSLQVWGRVQPTGLSTASGPSRSLVTTSVVHEGVEFSKEKIQINC